MQTLTEKLIRCSLPDIFTDEDLHHLLDEPSPATRFGLVKRAMAAKEILKIRRGLYILAEPYRKAPVDLFHVAGRILRPSYISLESALSAHGWIPEGVFAITSCAFKRSREFVTPLGRFEYRKSPLHTLAGVEHRVSGQGNNRSPYLLASPLRALIDMAHERADISMDLAFLTTSLRIEEEHVRLIRPKVFTQLLAEKPRGAARRFLEGLKRELGL
jgi:hypothetical protein